MRKWTAHLQQQWQFGRSRFTEGLPMNDTLIKYTTEKFETCAAVGNSGGLLRARAGQVRESSRQILRWMQTRRSTLSVNCKRHKATGPTRVHFNAKRYSRRYRRLGSRGAGIREPGS